MPLVAQHDREFGGVGGGLLLDVAGDADLTLSAVNRRGRDECEFTFAVDVVALFEPSSIVTVTAGVMMPPAKVSDG